MVYMYTTCKFFWTFKSWHNSFLSFPLWTMNHLTVQKCIPWLSMIYCLFPALCERFIPWSPSIGFFVGLEQGYDISFLITNYHCEEMQKQKLIDFIIQFMEASLSLNLMFLILWPWLHAIVASQQSKYVLSRLASVRFLTVITWGSSILNSWHNYGQYIRP